MRRLFSIPAGASWRRLFTIPAGASRRRLVALAGSCTVLAGCEGAIWGNLAVLAVSVGIFMGTLSLGRVRRRE